MKKAYVKPEIMFENFSLSTNIAGDCERIVENPTRGTCGVPGSMPNMNLFSSTVSGSNGCQVWSDKDEDNDGFCYHVPTDQTELFNS